jgi:uncharacterized membrane protein YbhN (UPF0104 family)
MEPRAAARDVALPSELEPRRLRRRAGHVMAALAVLGLIVALAPGLDEVRRYLARAHPGWLAVAVVFEFLSGVSYVLMFRPVFCPSMRWRTAWRIAWSELAVGSLVPASGASGLALGAWILHRAGMAAEWIARRSVAFFLLKSSVNFVAVAVLGTVMAVGIAGPRLSLWLTAGPAAASASVVAIVLALPRLGPGRLPSRDASPARRAVAAARRAVAHGTAEAIAIVRSRNWLVLAGAIGYWAWDNAVLWATFHALGASPALMVILMGYLIGQLGGLLPIPGGVGGIDGGLAAALIVYGAPTAPAVAAVLAYRVILFWLPLIVGANAFASLLRDVGRPDHPDLCPRPG